MDYAVPASKIATLFSVEFVGIVADNPDQKIKLKMFNSELQNDHEIKRDIQRLVNDELAPRWKGRKRKRAGNR